MSGFFHKQTGNPRAFDRLWSYELKADRGFYKIYLTMLWPELISEA